MLKAQREVLEICKSGSTQNWDTSHVLVGWFRHMEILGGKTCVLTLNGRTRSTIPAVLELACMVKARPSTQRHAARQLRALAYERWVSATKLYQLGIQELAQDSFRRLWAQQSRSVEGSSSRLMSVSLPRKT